MLNNIQVPEPVNHMPEANQNIRHIRKWILFIGIPLLIVAIIVGVYFYSLRPRRSASQTVDQSSKSPEPRLQNPGSNSAILPDQSLSVLPGAEGSIANFKARFEAINKNLAEYDQIFQNINVSGSCYQSSQEANTKHDLWSISVITLLDQSFPLNPESETQKQDKYTELKQLDKDYTKNIKGFIESQEQVYKAWLDTKKTIFKICDSPIEQIGANCQESGKSIDNYKKLLIKENNQDLFTNLDKINDFCNQAPDLVKNDNDTKFNELNNAFGQAFGKIVSIYPNIGDKTKDIKEIQVKIKTLLTDLSK